MLDNSNIAVDDDIMSVIDNKVVEQVHGDLVLLWPHNYKQGEASDTLAPPEIAIDGAKIRELSVSGNLHKTCWYRKSSWRDY